MAKKDKILIGVFLFFFGFQITGETRSLQKFAPLLKNPDWRIREKTMRKISKIHTAESAEILIEGMKWEASNNLTKRREAMLEGYFLSLVRIGEPAKKIFKTYQNDKDIGEWVVIALGYLKDNSVVEKLIELLKNSPSGRIRAYSAGALGEVGDRRAIPVLKEALKDPYMEESGDKHKIIVPLVRECAKSALSKFGIVVDNKD